MPVRKEVFANNEIYHLLNRGLAGQPFFSSTSDYRRFLNLVSYYQHVGAGMSYSHFFRLTVDLRREAEAKLKLLPLRVEIYAYCLMPNHFHLLLKQLTDNGINEFVSILENAYAKYMNTRTERKGPLYEGRFKAKHIETDELLLHVSRYIHLNPSTAYLISSDKLEDYEWSSLRSYMNKGSSSLVNTDMILNIVGGYDKYFKFIFDQVSYQKQLAEIKHLLLED